MMDLLIIITLISSLGLAFHAPTINKVRELVPGMPTDRVVISILIMSFLMFSAMLIAITMFEYYSEVRMFRWPTAIWLLTVTAYNVLLMLGKVKYGPKYGIALKHQYLVLAVYVAQFIITPFI